MNKITNFLCLSLLLLGASALGMNPSFASSLASGGQVNPERQLIEAAVQGELEEVEELIAQGVSIEVKDSYGSIPLIVAAANGHENVCKLLIACGASVEAKNNYGWTPLFLAALNGHEDVCRLLIDVQLEPARKDKAAIVTFLGIVRNRKRNLPCHMHYDVAKIIDRQAFEIVRQKNWSVIEQLNQLDDQIKAKWLVYLNEQMNTVKQ